MVDLDTTSADAQAIVLICSSLAAGRADGSSKPFGPRSWAKLRAALDRQSFPGPGSLLGLTATEIDRSLGLGVAEAERLARLLGRGGQLAFELDRLRSRGIWVVTLADEAYPTRLRQRLGPDAPPVLFGAGEGSLLERGGIAIVGSREADDDALAYTARLAAGAAAAETAVVSGGARGVDVAAMRAAFDHGGTVIGVLPEGVERRIRDTSARQAIVDGSAVLVSPYHPASAFSAGAAMARNKLIYALADVAVIVSTAAGSGGTWTGALEALEARWVPVLVRDGDSVPNGNRELLARGAAPLRSEALADRVSVFDLVALTGTATRRVAEAPPTYRQESLFPD